MVRRSTRVVGRRAEVLARRYLERKGLITIEQNYQRRFGEIDLIMRDADCLVFVEVRYRARRGFTPAAPTVDSHKQRKLIRTASLYLAKRPQYATGPMRFDVLAIDGESIDWIRDAFRPADNAF